MDSPLTRAIIIGCVGAIIGYSTGVVALGGGVNGAAVFGPIGFIIGWLLPLGSKPTDASPGVESKGNITPSEPLRAGDFRNVEKSMSEMGPIAGRVLVSIWNIEMKALIAVGVMEYFIRYPWLLFLLAFLLLAVFFPLGAFFSVTGAAAFHYNAKAEDQYLVRLDPAS